MLFCQWGLVLSQVFTMKSLCLNFEFLQFRCQLSTGFVFKGWIVSLVILWYDCSISLRSLSQVNSVNLLPLLFCYLLNLKFLII